MKRSWLLATLGVVAMVVVATLLAVLIPESSSNKKLSTSCFRAATLDHVQQAKGEDHSTNIDLNLQVYVSAATLAKQNGADIVVFPENGILFSINTRNIALTYGEKIPSTKVDVCTDEFKTKTPIIYRLACIAKENKIFVTANVVDVQDCDNAQDSKCPADKKFAFNTAVLFDRNGNLLAKYHKMHPFGEMALNVPPNDELIVVDTELGRFGMQVCFDMIYNKPGVLLAAQKKIDTMLFPTWWFDELPFLGAAQFQMAWSFGNKINVIGSNIHKIEVGSRGSGIYAGGRDQFEVINFADSKSRLLVANLPIDPTSNAQCAMDAKTVEVPQLVPVSNDVQYKYQIMNLTQTEIVKIDPNQEDLISKCSLGVCCTLQYQVDSSSLKADEAFYLIVSNRTRPGAYPWTEEYCGLVHCPQLTNLDACALITSNSPLQTKFSFVQLSGDFSMDTLVYPSVIGSEHEVLPKSGGMWSYSDEKSSKSKQKYVLTFGDKAAKKSYSVSTIGLYGRIYSRDPPYVQVPTQGPLRQL